MADVFDVLCKEVERGFKDAAYHFWGSVIWKGNTVYMNYFETETTRFTQVIWSFGSDLISGNISWSVQSIAMVRTKGPGTTTMEPNDLDSRKSLLPDELMFPVEIITRALEDYPNFKSCLQKSSDSITFTPADRSKLHSELSRMKSELLAKQQLYQAQFDELKNWMKESFEVDSPQVLLDHQTKIRDAEMVAEEAATQGNSKQHQRIRALNS